MIHLKSDKEISLMQAGGQILSKILGQLETATKVGVKTKELDKLSRELISSNEAKPSFLNYNGFPAALCVSINDEIVHGLPSERILKNGDLVKLDLGILYKGFHTDSARTVLVGVKDPKKQKLIDVTRQALEIGISEAQVGNTLGDVGHAIQKYVQSQGFDVVRDLIGHGIGKDVHEEPEVLNYGKAGGGEKLKVGMVIAIEPMVVEGSYKIANGQDGFSYVTEDGKLAAHFEHTVAITKDGPLILTQ